VPDALRRIVVFRVGLSCHRTGAVRQREIEFLVAKRSRASYGLDCRRAKRRILACAPCASAAPYSAGTAGQHRGVRARRQRGSIVKFGRLWVGKQEFKHVKMNRTRRIGLDWCVAPPKNTDCNRPRSYWSPPVGAIMLEGAGLARLIFPTQPLGTRLDADHR